MFTAYRKLQPHIIDILIADFFIQLINSSFFLLLNYYMDIEGYQDYEMADFVSYRFLAVMAFAFPLGLFIKGRKLKPFFLISVIITPLMALLILYAIGAHNSGLLYTGMMLWGISFTCLHVCAMPFILLNAKKETHSEAIALFFMTWSLSMVLCGILNFSLNHLLPNVFDLKTLLQLFSILGFVGIFFVLRIRVKENVSEKTSILKSFNYYDWGLILKTLIPTLIIAVGAGFTIPFINLFFLNVHGVDAASFSLLGTVTYTLVAFGTLIIPSIKRRFGYETAITLVQSLSVLALILLVTTEFYNHLWFSLYIAIFFYIIRQPLMNVSGPMTTELTMYYVGSKNQELLSALNVSIWSGSWFISSQIFRVLRTKGLDYGYIFLITAALYIVGILLYYFLIKDYHRRKQLFE